MLFTKGRAFTAVFHFDTRDDAVVERIIGLLFFCAMFFELLLMKSFCLFVLFLFLFLFLFCFVLFCSGRRVHPSSGRVYHLKFRPPRIAGFDDVCTGNQREERKSLLISRMLVLFLLLFPV